MFTFEYDYENEVDETDTAFAQRTVSGEADLDEVLTAVRDFLQLAGFNYVSSIVAVKDDGTECSSN